MDSDDPEEEKVRTKATHAIAEALYATSEEGCRDALRKAVEAMESRDIEVAEILLIQVITKSDEEYTPNTDALKEAWTRIMAYRSFVSYQSDE